VKTRTLLILSVVTASMILIAGIFLLLRIDGSSGVASALKIGDRAQAGDAMVTVLSASPAGVDSHVAVVVTVAGVADADGFDDFRLVGPNVVAGPSPDGTCIAMTVDEQTCSLDFDVASFPNLGSRLLVWQRADTVVRWTLDERPTAADSQS
jgi:hypothetical protein